MPWISLEKIVINTVFGWQKSLTRSLPLCYDPFADGFSQRFQQMKALDFS